MSIFSYSWPIIIMVVAQCGYQISAKSAPEAMDPYAAVFFNYVFATALSFVLWMVLGENHSLTTQIEKMNWAPLTMAISITMVEIASIFMYRIGWDVSIGSTIANIGLAVVLVFVGMLWYKEVITAQKIIGVGLCIVGLVVMNKG
ncbi:MAG: EamA family transporter [Firmicutes bacterium]|jgi:drug/metabolite transporter (DMT)-like permease|nr:EamA family transporter [Bacillota bacterium]